MTNIKTFPITMTNDRPQFWSVNRMAKIASMYFLNISSEGYFYINHIFCSVEEETDFWY